MRSAIKRYFDSGDAATEAEAITLLWEQNLLPHKLQMEAKDPYYYN